MCSASMMSVRQRDAMFVHACRDTHLALAEASVDLYRARVYLFRALYEEENRISPAPIPAWLRPGVLKSKKRWLRLDSSLSHVYVFSSFMCHVMTTPVTYSSALIGDILWRRRGTCPSAM